MTPRELQVLSLAAEGLSNKLIAVSLGIKYETVRTHMQNIEGKLAASDRTHAVVTAHRLGIIDLGARAA